MKKIAFCVPSTSNGTDWKTAEDSYMYKYLLKNLNKLGSSYDITLYIGIDRDEPFYNITIRNQLESYADKIKFVWDIWEGCAGNPVGIWNQLGRRAYEEGNEYFKILGDDIELDKKTEWLGRFIKQLKSQNNIGWVAGHSGNDQLPTQFLVHRKHWEIFSFIYPPQLKNWFCDHWLAMIYDEDYRMWFWNYKHMNQGGAPRYIPENAEKKCLELVKKYKKYPYTYIRNAENQKSSRST